MFTTLVFIFFSSGANLCFCSSQYLGSIAKLVALSTHHASFPSAMQVNTSSTSSVVPESTSQNDPGRKLADRAAKRRSSHACLSCRSRKVRCDVLNGGLPCTNCRLDHVNCVLKESSRGRKRSSRPRNGSRVLQQSRDSQDTRENREFPNSSPAVSAVSSCSVRPSRQQVIPPHTDLVSLTFEGELEHFLVCVLGPR